MRKRIYDILPPKLAHKVEDTIKTLEGGGKTKKHHKKITSPKQERRFPLKEILAGSAVVVFLFGFYLYNKLPKADIEIWPKLDVVTLQETVTASKLADAVDFSKKIIPARYLEFEKDGWQTFPSTGIAPSDGKSSGTIKVYNKINPPTSFVLKKGTHFLSDSGKYFVTLEKITIPASKNNSAGSVDVNVEAEESGADYNIGASKFSVPKLSGTLYYYSVWGESNSQMAGGYSGKVKKVTDSDIASAKDVIIKKLSKEAGDMLKSTLSPDDVLVEGATLIDDTGAGSSLKAGSIADTFDEQGKVKISAVVFKKQDLEKFAKDDIASQLPDGKKILEKSLGISYNPLTTDVKGGSETLDVQLSSKAYYGVDTNDLVDLFGSKSAGEIREIVNNMYNGKISDLQVNFWPFWVHKTTNNKNRIKVNLHFE